MFYAKRNYRKYRRYRRTGRLSTTRILTNKGATSQAKQILALRRKVNHVYRATKPEFKLLQSVPQSSTFNNSSVLTNTYHIVFHAPTQGSDDGQRIGNVIRIIKGILYLNVEYQIQANNNTEEPSFHLGEASGCQIRVICVQPKQALTASQINDFTPADFLAYGGETGDSYSMRTVSPFKANITEYFDILADRKYVVTANKPILETRIKCPKRTARWSDDDEKTTMPFFMIITSGLHADANFTDRVIATYAHKYVFTDA